MGRAWGRHGMVKTRMRKEYLLVALVVALIQIAWGFNSMYFNPTDVTPYPSDGLSRVANAFYVLFCDPPTLANIGGVWNPLPSILEIPLVWLSQFWKPLASYGLAGVVVSSLFTGGTAGLLVHAFTRFSGLTRAASYVLTGLFIFNPFFFYYGYNGMSETMSYFFVILTIYLLMWWMRTGKPFYVSAMGFSLMGLFFVRYEAIPFAVGIWLSMFAFIWFSKREQQYVVGGKWEKLHYVEATSFILALPILFGVLVWILYNWIILGDPLYFLHSAYSNSAQAAFAAQYASLAELVADIAPKIFPFILLYVFILLERLLTKRFLRVETLIVTLLVFSLLGFHIVMLMNNGSYGWLRFYAYAYPVCVIWFAYEVYDAREAGFSLVRWGGTLVIALSIVPCTVALNKFDYPSDGVRVIEQYQNIASYITENVAPDTLLMDSFTTYGILLQFDDLDHIVTSCNDTFAASLADPVRMEVGYVLVPDNQGANTSDSLLTKWPELGSGQEIDGFVLEETFYGSQTFYLYKLDYAAMPQQAAIE